MGYVRSAVLLAVFLVLPAEQLLAQCDGDLTDTRQLRQCYLYLQDEVYAPKEFSQTLAVVVPSFILTTPEIPVPKTCTPGNVLCAGPFTIPAQHLATTPGVQSPPVTVSVSTSRLDVGGVEFGGIGPVTVEVPTPFGPLPITICEDGCSVIPQPDVHGAVTVTVSVGTTSVSRTVAVP